MKLKLIGLLAFALCGGGATHAAGPSPITQILPVVSFRSDLGTYLLDPSAQANYLRALQSFRGRRYPDAYARFTRLADTGHVPSARIALMMLHHGRELFGSEWSASAEQQQYWTSVLANRALKGIEIVDDGRSD